MQIRYYIYLEPFKSGSDNSGFIRMFYSNRKNSYSQYDKQKHRERLEIILDKWDGILNIINEELPSSEYIEALMLRLGLPIDISEIGIDEKLMPDIFRASKDIRDKYVLPRLLWDLGIIDEFATNINQ